MRSKRRQVALLIAWALLGGLGLVRSTPIYAHSPAAVAGSGAVRLENQWVSVSGDLVRIAVVLRNVTDVVQKEVKLNLSLLGGGVRIEHVSFEPDKTVLLPGESTIAMKGVYIGENWSEEPSAVVSVSANQGVPSDYVYAFGIRDNVYIEKVTDRYGARSIVTVESINYGTDHLSGYSERVDGTWRSGLPIRNAVVLFRGGRIVSVIRVPYNWPNGNLGPGEGVIGRFITGIEFDYATAMSSAVKMKADFFALRLEVDEVTWQVISSKVGHWSHPTVKIIIDVAATTRNFSTIRTPIGAVIVARDRSGMPLGWLWCDSYRDIEHDATFKCRQEMSISVINGVIEASGGLNHDFDDVASMSVHAVSPAEIWASQYGAPVRWEHRCYSQEPRLTPPAWQAVLATGAIRSRLFLPMLRQHDGSYCTDAVP